MDKLVVFLWAPRKAGLDIRTWVVVVYLGCKFRQPGEVIWKGDRKRKRTNKSINKPTLCRQLEFNPTRDILRKHIEHTSELSHWTMRRLGFYLPIRTLWVRIDSPWWLTHWCFVMRLCDGASFHSVEKALWQIKEPGTQEGKLPACQKPSTTVTVELRAGSRGYGVNTKSICHTAYQHLLFLSGHYLALTSLGLGISFHLVNCYSSTPCISCVSANQELLDSVILL